MHKAKPLQAPPPSFYQVAINDYILDHQSHNLTDGQTRADVSFHLGAPQGLLPQDDAMHLFLDPASHVARQLPANAWQIHCDDSVTESEFHPWAQQTVQLMLETMLGKNMLGFEFVSEIGNLLSGCTEGHIEVRQIPLNQAEQLSQQLAGNNAQAAWLALFGQQLSMGQYAHTLSLFENIVQPDGRLLSSVNIPEQGEDWLMVLTVQQRQ